MKYSGYKKLLCEFSELSESNVFYPPRILNYQLELFSFLFLLQFSIYCRQYAVAVYFSFTYFLKKFQLGHLEFLPGLGF